MDTLFSDNERARQLKNAPLAVRMRPTTLDDYVGQEKAVGPGSWLRSAIEHDVLSSVILYGPAGTGKTTLAHIIASHTKSEFVEVSAVTGTVKDLRREIEEAKRRLMMFDRRTILFIDEIHRFSRSQQDALLHAVENRTGRPLRTRTSRSTPPCYPAVASWSSGISRMRTSSGSFVAPSPRPRALRAVSPPTMRSFARFAPWPPATGGAR